MVSAKGERGEGKEEEERKEEELVWRSRSQTSDFLTADAFSDALSLSLSLLFAVRNSLGRRSAANLLSNRE